MNDIGGYFELELSNGGNHYHDTPCKMKSGRSALHYIFTVVKPTLVYVPYYTCDSLLEPFKVANINYEFYGINENLEPVNDIDLKEGEYLVYVNYMDMKRDTVSWLSEKYRDKLIVDGTQAFFMKGNGVSWFFNSCRKFFGVPDGAYLYPPSGVDVQQPEVQNEAYITDHLLKRFNGHTNDGYKFFQENETLADCQLTGMSKLSEQLLSVADYGLVIEKRLEHFNYLHDRLKHYNHFRLSQFAGNVPMCYPLLPDKSIDKGLLHAQHIFVPAFWQDVIGRGADGFDFEKNLSKMLLPLPIDHRYSLADMEFIVSSVTKIIL